MARLQELRRKQTKSGAARVRKIHTGTKGKKPKIKQSLPKIKKKGAKKRSKGY